MGFMIKNFRVPKLWGEAVANLPFAYGLNDVGPPYQSFLFGYCPPFSGQVYTHFFAHLLVFLSMKTTIKVKYMFLKFAMVKKILIFCGMPKAT